MVFLNCDNSPTKKHLIGLEKDPKLGEFYEINFGKRPEDELYKINEDPDCMINLANDENYIKLKDSLWTQLKKKLIDHGDPRVLGKGEIFDYYPNTQIERQQKLYQNPDFNPIKILEEKFNQKININN